MLHKDTKNSQIKDKGQLDYLADMPELLSAKFDGLQKDREKKDKKNWELKKKNESLESIQIGG